MNKRWVLLLLVVALLVVCGLMVRDLFAFGVDDSFIFYRYAENVAAGHGFVFNVGEPAGEGFTSWVWTLLLAFFHWLGVENLVLVSKVLGIVSHVLAAGLMYVLVQLLLVPGVAEREWRSGVGEYDFTASAPWIGLVLAGVFLLNYRLLAHSVSGMETPLYVFGVLGVVYLTLRGLLSVLEDSRSLKWWGWIAVATFGLFLVRPEGIMVGGLSLLAMVVVRPKDLLKLRVWGYLVAGLGLPLGLFLGYKLLVFGYLMPHSYYHKLIVLRAEYNDSLRHLLQFVSTYGWLMVLALISGGYALVRQRKYIYLYFVLLFGVMSGIYLLFYPVMNYLHRFYMPYVPLLWLLLVPLLGLLVRAMARPGFRPFLEVVLAILLVLLVLRGNTGMERMQKVVKGWSGLVNPRVSRALLGRVMADLPGDMVVANSEMGVIPYYSGLTCIDMAGLTDPQIAHFGLTMKYLVERGVELILFPKEVAKISAAQWQAYTLNYKDVFLSARFRERFRLLGSYPGRKGEAAQYFLYVDTGSPRFEAVQRWWQEFEGHAAGTVKQR